MRFLKRLYERVVVLPWMKLSGGAKRPAYHVGLTHVVEGGSDWRISVNANDPDPGDPLHAICLHVCHVSQVTGVPVAEILDDVAEEIESPDTLIYFQE